MDPIFLTPFGCCCLSCTVSQTSEVETIRIDPSIISDENDPTRTLTSAGGLRSCLRRVGRLILACSSWDSPLSVTSSCRSKMGRVAPCWFHRQDAYLHLMDSHRRWYYLVFVEECDAVRYPTSHSVYPTSHSVHSVLPLWEIADAKSSDPHV